jgi:hypothetical protein
MFAATLIGAVNVLSSFKMACDDQETATQNDTSSAPRYRIKFIPCQGSRSG